MEQGKNTSDFLKPKLLKIDYSEARYMPSVIKPMEDIIATNIPLTDVLIMKDFVYKTYPTFFLSGIQIGLDCFILNEMGEVKMAVDLKNHYPSTFMYSGISGYLRILVSRYSWELTYEDAGDIVGTCMRDMVKSYEKRFPYTVRFFSSNYDKVVNYQKYQSNMEFGYFEFVEIQGTVESIVQDKLDQIVVEDLIKDDAIVVDDTGLEFCALMGCPGPYIKDFIAQNSYESISPLLIKLGDRRAFLHIALGMKVDNSNIVVHARFPVVWQYHGQTKECLDAYLYYKGAPSIFRESRFTSPCSVLMYWLWHKYWRIKDGK